MTAPVLTMITPGQGPACENNFTMLFFMSPEVKTPPTPTEKGVFPQDMPKMNVYVRYKKCLVCNNCISLFGFNTKGFVCFLSKNKCTYL